MSTALERMEKQLALPALLLCWSQTASSLPSVTAALAAAPSRPTPPALDVPVPLLLNLESDRELLLEFINESQEHLANIENGVLVLEEDPTNADTLNTIFRAFHTFKGGSGFLNLLPIQALAHELESLLDAARQHKLALSSPIIDVILEGGDTLKKFVTQMVERINNGDASKPILIPTGALIAKVKAILANPTAAIPVNPQNAPAPKDEQAASIAIAATPTKSAEVDSAKPASSAPPTSPSAGYVKVDTVKLDSLIDLVGELVISESMVVQDPELAKLSSQHLARNLGQLRRITSELQRTAMSLRMVPIRSTFQKMTRLVRDLAAKQNKLVQLVLSGRAPAESRSGGRVTSLKSHQ